MYTNTTSPTNVFISIMITIIFLSGITTTYNILRALFENQIFTKFKFCIPITYI